MSDYKEQCLKELREMLEKRISIADTQIHEHVIASIAERAFKIVTQYEIDDLVSQTILKRPKTYPRKKRETKSKRRKRR